MPNQNTSIGHLELADQISNYDYGVVNDLQNSHKNARWHKPACQTSAYRLPASDRLHRARIRSRPLSFELQQQFKRMQSTNRLSKSAKTSPPKVKAWLEKEKRKPNRQIKSLETNKWGSHMDFNFNTDNMWCTISNLTNNPTSQDNENQCTSTPHLAHTDSTKKRTLRHHAFTNKISICHQLSLLLHCLPSERKMLPRTSR